MARLAHRALAAHPGAHPAPRRPGAAASGGGAGQGWLVCAPSYSRWATCRQTLTPRNACARPSAFSPASRRASCPALPVFATGLLSNALAGVLLRGLATDAERQVVLRGLPHNPTTEMDLALWALAQEVRADPPPRERCAKPAGAAGAGIPGGDLPPEASGEP